MTELIIASSTKTGKTNMLIDRANRECADGRRVIFYVQEYDEPTLRKRGLGKGTEVVVEPFDGVSLERIHIDFGNDNEMTVMAVRTTSNQAFQQLCAPE